MILSLDWLCDYVALPIDVDLHALAHALTLHAVEVESVERLDLALKECVFAKVLHSTSAGPADWRVEVECGPFGPIVASSRTRLEAGCITVIQPVTGGSYAVKSPADLGVDLLVADRGPSGWLVPAADPTAGEAVAPLLGWDDVVIEIDNKSLTNRPDLWCHAGMARELAAIFEATYHDPFGAAPRAPASGAGKRLIAELDPSFCNRFSVMEIKRHGALQPETPLLVRSRLAKVGQRPINFYTDLTNYVMFAAGQPSHAYDARLAALPFSARRSRGVVLDSLAGVVSTVPEGVPMIIDDLTEVAVAGVVGGRATSVTHQTHDVLIEMASFDARSVRDSSLSLGLRTDASSRFEKGLDTQAIDRGRDLLLHLIRQHDPSSEVTAIEDVAVWPTMSLAVETSLQYLNSRMGTQLSDDDVTRLLAPLGFGVRPDRDVLLVDVPTWRATGDVGIAADILEEVGRRIGYDELPQGNPSIKLRRPTPNPVLEAERRIREFLAFQMDAQEILTYPWVTDRLLELCGIRPAEQVHIMGAPSEDRSALRPSLIPNLLGAIEVNLAHRADFRLFELGAAYARPASRALGAEPQLSQRLAVAFVGPSLVTGFRTAVGAIRGIARAARTQLHLVEPISSGWGDPIAARSIVDSARNCEVGRLAAVDLSAVAGDTRGSVAVCIELETSHLAIGPSRDNPYVPVSSYPTTTFDLSIVVPQKASWSELRAAIDAAPIEHLRMVEFLDEFRGGSLEPEQKSITFRLTLGSSDRTLTPQDRDLARQTCVTALVNETGWRLR